jgi:hypothetical protein
MTTNKLGKLDRVSPPTVSEGIFGDIQEGRPRPDVTLLNGRRVRFGSKSHVRELQRSIMDLERRRGSCRRGTEARATFSRALGRLKGELRSALRNSDNKLQEVKTQYATSRVPSNLAQATASHGLELAGLGDIKFRVGAIANMSDEVVVTVDTGDVEELLGLDRGSDSELWNALDRHLDGGSMQRHRVDPGASEVLLVVPLVDDAGNGHAVDSDGDVHSDETGLVPVRVRLRRKSQGHVTSDARWNSLMSSLTAIIGRAGDSVDDVVEAAFGGDYSVSDVDTFEKLVTAFKGEQFLHPELRSRVWDAFTRADR